MGPGTAQLGLIQGQAQKQHTYSPDRDEQAGGLSGSCSHLGMSRGQGSEHRMLQDDGNGTAKHRERAQRSEELSCVRKLGEAQKIIRTSR